MNNKIHDKYATKPRTINQYSLQQLNTYLSQLQIDGRRIETTPYYLRPPWRKNCYEQIDQYYSAQSQRDQVASDFAQKQERYWKKNTRKS
jgi:hypothetical protein